MEYTQNRILEYEQLYADVKDRTTLAYLDMLNVMRFDYEELGEDEKCLKTCNEIVKLILTSNFKRDNIDIILLAAYDSKARLGDFRAYCIALEWNRPIEKQFFLPRKRILEQHGLIQAMQDMADDKLDFLFISLPPRIGKSTLGIFFLTFMAGRFPERSILGNGHSNSLTQAFYNEILNIMTSEELKKYRCDMRNDFLTEMYEFSKNYDNLLYFLDIQDEERLVEIVKNKIFEFAEVFDIIDYNYSKKEKELPLKVILNLSS